MCHTTAESIRASKYPALLYLSVWWEHQSDVVFITFLGDHSNKQLSVLHCCIQHNTTSNTPALCQHSTCTFVISVTEDTWARLRTTSTNNILACYTKDWFSLSDINSEVPILLFITVVGLQSEHQNHRKIKSKCIQFLLCSFRTSKESHLT